ncbi:MAG: hypothetical protein ACI8V2_005348, partial [Candidatus Latescibacterota bacterium]
MKKSSRIGTIKAHLNRVHSMYIQTGLIFRKLFNLPLRQTEGFLESLIQLLKISLKVPDYSTFC